MIHEISAADTAAMGGCRPKFSPTGDSTGWSSGSTDGPQSRPRLAGRSGPRGPGSGGPGSRGLRAVGEATVMTERKEGEAADVVVCAGEFRFVRLLISRPATQWGSSVWRFQIWGYAADGTTTGGGE